MRNKRTDINFSNHILSIINNSNVIIYEFKKPGTNVDSVVFINSCGVLTVTGDFGNWVFNREFHPSIKNKVSAGYWDEKLQIASVQRAKEYDAETTLDNIISFKKSFKENYDRKMNSEEKEWVKELINNVEYKEAYIYLAYKNLPNTIDFESIPFGKKRHFWLEVIYDAFDKICDLIPENK